jgi:hypothetical protein
MVILRIVLNRFNQERPISHVALNCLVLVLWLPLRRLRICQQTAQFHEVFCFKDDFSFICEPLDTTELPFTRIDMFWLIKYGVPHRNHTRSGRPERRQRRVRIGRVQLK